MAAPLAPELSASRPPRTLLRDRLSLALAALLGLLASSAVAHALYQGDRESWLNALLALTLGLAATALLLFHLTGLTRRARAVDRQVALGTRSLAEANRQLRRDADEHGKNLRAAAENEARYRLLADHASDIISRQDERGVIIYLSPACHAILGYDPAELAGRRSMSFVHPEDRPAVRERLRAAVGEDGSCTVTFRVRHRDNSRNVWLETVYRALPSDGADVSGSVAISRDVTARIEAEHALRDSEFLFRRVFEGAAVGMAFISPAGMGFLRANHALAHMLGYSIAELEEKSLADVTHPADQHISPSEMQQVLSGAKDSYLTEKRCLHKNGSTVWVLGYTTLIREPCGEPRYFVSQLQDISERKRAAHRFSQLTHQRDLILNAVGEGIYGIDPNGHATFVNRAAADALGYDPDDLVGVDMHARTHHTRHGEPHRWQDSRVFRSIHDRETHYVDDEVFWHRDGDPVHVQYVSSPIIDQGRAMGAVVVFSELASAVEPDAAEDAERVQESVTLRPRKTRWSD